MRTFFVAIALISIVASNSSRAAEDQERTGWRAWIGRHWAGSCDAERSRVCQTKSDQCTERCGANYEYLHRCQFACLTQLKSCKSDAGCR